MTQQPGDPQNPDERPEGTDGWGQHDDEQPTTPFSDAEQPAAPQPDTGGYPQPTYAAPPQGAQTGPQPQTDQPPYGQPQYDQAQYDQPQWSHHQSGQPQPGIHPQPGSQPGQPSSNAVEAKGFFAALFDFSFRSFITIKFAKFVYALLIIFAALSWLFMTIAGFATGEPVLGILALLLGWIPAAFYIVIYRITLEVMISLVRTSQSTAATQQEVAQLRGDLLNR